MQFNRQAFKWLCGVTLVGACVFAAGMAKDAADEKQDKKPKKAKLGAAAPDFELKSIDGKSYKLSDFEDKIVVLEWFSITCPYVVAAADMMAKTSDKYVDDEMKESKVVWFAVDSTAEASGSHRSDEQVKAYAKSNKLTYPILRDPSGKVGKAYGAQTTPHIFIIKDGKLVYKGGHADGRGVEPGDRNYIAETLDALLAGKDVPAKETRNRGCSVKYAK
jgi:peroxiredoxin